jgi:DNA-binding NarL/FixJ family response regulator
VPAIRTATIALAPMFRDLITELIASRRRLDVIAEFDDSNGIEARLRAAAPQLILLGLRRGQDDRAAQALAMLVPEAQLIAFSDDRRHAFVYRGRERRIALIDFSAQMLIDAIADP